MQTLTAGSYLGYVQGTVTAGVAITLPSLPALATSALIVTSANCHFREDGVAPTSTIGMPLTAAQNVLIDPRSNLMGFRIIADTGPATLDITYYSAIG